MAHKVCVDEVFVSQRNLYEREYYSVRGGGDGMN